VVESGSDVAAELWNAGHSNASSILSYPEGRAALAAACRAGRLTAQQHAQAIADFEDVQRELLLLGVDQDLAQAAGRLAEDLGLRGYDAVHLAVALALGGDAVTLVTWDRELGDAALQVGLAVAPKFLKA
jgi:predicted nucleic acid-binding protein